MQCRSLHCFPITGDAFYHYVMVFLEICCFKIPPLSCIIHFCWDCTLQACFMEKLCSRWVKALLFSPSCSNKRIRCECNGRTPSQRSSRCFLRVPRWSWHSCGAFAQEVQRCQHGDSGFNVWKCIIWSKVLSIDGIKRHRRRLTDSFFPLIPLVKVKLRQWRNCPEMHRGADDLSDWFALQGSNASSVSCSAWSGAGQQSTPLKTLSFSPATRQHPLLIIMYA